MFSYDDKQSINIIKLGNHEVFVGGLSPDITEIDLLEVFKRIGNVISNRIIRNQGISKGYAFIGFETQEEVEKAVQELQHTKIKESVIELKIGKTNNILFCVGIRKSWNESKVDELFKNTVANAVKVTVIADPKTHGLNRGYFFVRFNSHQNALKALQRINKEEFLLGGMKIQANWADTQNNFEEDDGINVY